MIVGTAGHIDHGKTALVRALTGVETDRLKEEKARGISIDLGFAYLPAGDDVIGFVDVPGHEKFVRNMLAGATGIDVVLLVVAADDGVMPQTIEHLAIINLLGIAQGIVALTKVDLVPQQRRDEAAREITELLATTRLAGAEIVPVSTVSGEGIAALGAKLGALATSVAGRTTNGCFRLAVDRSFTLDGIGTVVTGTVMSGVVNVGDHVVVSPSGLTARVRSIHAQNRPAKVGRAGERCGINLAGENIAKDAIQRGDVLLDPVLHEPASRIDATLRVLASETRPVRQRMPLRLHHAAAEVGARVHILDAVQIAPGGEARVQLVLDHPIAAATGDRYVVRDTSGRRTIGGGRLLDLRAPVRRRRSPERLALLDAHAIGKADDAFAALLERAPYYVDVPAFARDRAIKPAEFQTTAAAVCIAAQDTTYAVSTATRNKLRGAIVAAVEKYHVDNPGATGVALERLRSQVEPRQPAAVFGAVIAQLARAKDIVLDGGAVRRRSHLIALTPQDERLWQQIVPLLTGVERFRPPRLPDMVAQTQAKESDLRRLMKSLTRLGMVSEVAADHFFPRETLAEITAIAAELAASSKDGQFTAAQFRDRLDNGRKVAIQLLEFLDRNGITGRRGDLRVVNRAKLGLFG